MIGSITPNQLMQRLNIKHGKKRIHDFTHSPLSLSKLSRQTAKETSLLDESLETLLSHKNGQVAFREFLKSEFCEENLDFWLVCQQFRALGSPEELTQRATSIYEEFIQAESPRQVNLDFYIRNTISQDLQQPNPLCFDAAQKKIYSLMENDSFPRFIRSDMYKALLSSASKQKRSGKHHKALKSKNSEDLKQYDLKPISLQNELCLRHKKTDTCFLTHGHRLRDCK
ncbi:regulator of G-protein signaling 21-like [Genypterus blacodes]|uniref:regulator of G-protein signaling 21-like n=1 Tax=Genypterus blacodes TaxID=154954 RepID=UPI003F768C5B